MSFYEEIDSVKIEKDKAMLRYLRFSKIGNVFRTLEFFIAILFITWSIFRSSPYLSASFHLSAVFLRRLSTLVVNHHFVFLIGNGIIAALFVKFGQFASCDETASADRDDDDEYRIGESVPPYDVTSREITVFEEKRIIPAEKEVRTVVEETRDPPIVKRCRRSRSEVFDRRKTEKLQIRLRRSETEPRRSSVKETAPVEDDNLSNDEFKRKVEAVIERHRRSLREESWSSSSFIVTA